MNVMNIHWLLSQHALSSCLFANSSKFLRGGSVWIWGLWLRLYSRCGTRDLDSSNQHRPSHFLHTQPPSHHSDWCRDGHVTYVSLISLTHGTWVGNLDLFPFGWKKAVSSEGCGNHFDFIAEKEEKSQILGALIDPLDEVSLENRFLCLFSNINEENLSFPFHLPPHTPSFLTIFLFLFLSLPCPLCPCSFPSFLFPSLPSSLLLLSRPCLLTR